MHIVRRSGSKKYAKDERRKRNKPNVQTPSLNNPAVSNKKDIAHVSIIQTTREMNSSSSSFASSKVNKTYSKDPADLVTINEKVKGKQITIYNKVIKALDGIRGTKQA